MNKNGKIELVYKTSMPKVTKEIIFKSFKP